ncbi:MAG: hypothetical protein IPH00_16690 [Flavobacteriales bacterium]|nr:hypothetical protein [Flavobacteriales bacterium]
MTAPTLFDDARTVAIRDMVALFRVQLKDAETRLEREELLLAIRSWEAQLRPQLPANQPANAASHEHLQSLL